MNWKYLIFVLIIAVFVGGFFTGFAANAIIEQMVQIHNIGTIKTIGVEVYQDEALTSILDEIAWSDVYLGTTKSVNAWVKNTGNDAQKLVMWTENWNPLAASNVLTLTWNYNDSWIPANASILVVFTLSADSNTTDVTSFSFDIWVKGVA